MRVYGNINKGIDPSDKCKTDIVSIFQRHDINSRLSVWTFIYNDVKISDGDYIQFWLEITKWEFWKLHTLIRTIYFNNGQAA